MLAASDCEDGNNFHKDIKSHNGMFLIYFQGRMLHILPGKAKSEEMEIAGKDI